MKKRIGVGGLLGLAAAAGLAPVNAWAQPAMVFVGPMSASDMTPDGTAIVGSATGGAGIWRLNGGVPTFQFVTGATNDAAPHCGDDAAFLSGSILNTEGAGGLPTNKIISARWAAGEWRNLGVFSGATACDATISLPYNISPTGQYVVGGGWINCKYRAYIWDAATGVMTNLGVLDPNRSSRANCVSSDGSLVAGFDESPLTGVRRPAIWFNGVEQVLVTTGEPATEGGEVYAMNRAGTILIGTSFLYPNQIVRWTGSGTSWTQESLGSIPAIPNWVYNYFFNPEIRSVSPVALTDDGQTIVGAVTYVEPGSFPVNGGFLYTPSLGVVDLTTHLSDHNAIGLSAFGLAGNPVAISNDGRTIAGLTVGAGSWAVYLEGTPCQTPSAVVYNSAISVSPGGLAVLNCGVTGSAPATFQWRLNGAPITNGTQPNGSSYSGATTARLVLNNAACENGGAYTCVATNSCGSGTTPEYTLVVTGCPTCYPNCDASTAAPVLNVNDFVCFQNKFAAGDTYANCDQSTTAPVLNVNDFVCFQSQFAAGCR
jgi:uncharacterized membrane protein